VDGTTSSLFVDIPQVISCIFSWILRRNRKIAKSNYELRHVCMSVCCPSVCPSVCMEQLGSHWMDFLESWYLKIFRKSVQKIQGLLYSYKNDGCSHEAYIFKIMLTWSLLRIRNISDIGAQKINTRNLLSIIFSENLSWYETMWKNIAETGRHHITI